MLESLFNNKVPDLPAALLKRNSTIMFSGEIYEIFKDTFSHRTPTVAVSVYFTP